MAVVNYIANDSDLFLKNQENQDQVFSLVITTPSDPIPTLTCGNPVWRHGGLVALLSFLGNCREVHGAQ